MTAPTIQYIDWPDIERWLRAVPSVFAFDAIVGVERAGLPIAVTLSYLVPSAPLAILERRGPRGEKPNLYDFSADRGARMKHLSDTFYVSGLSPGASRVLIVDDVATFGDTLFIAREKVLEIAPQADVQFCCYAVDSDRVTQSRPGMLEKIHHHISIDNSKIWVSFPWTVTP